MPITSPLGYFVEVLLHVRDTALAHQGKLSKSEASTRVALIDPVLKALGWDPTNPDMIEFERTLPQARADYALYDQDNKIQVIIEAKALGVNLGDNRFIFNLIMYAIAAGIKDIFLTDGVIWEHYSNFTPGNVMSSKTLDFTKDNLVECATYLVNEIDAAKFWQVMPDTKGLVNEQLSKQILDLRSEISNLRNSLLILQNTPGTTVELPIPDPISDTKEVAFTELAKLPSSLTGMKPPTTLRMPDGTIRKISKWRDILLECALYVITNTPKLPIPLPDAAGKKVALVDVNPPKNAVGHYKFNTNGENRYIYLNYDSSHCVLNAIHVLKYLDSEKNKTKVAVGFDDQV